MEGFIDLFKTKVWFQVAVVAAIVVFLYLIIILFIVMDKLSKKKKLNKQRAEQTEQENEAFKFEEEQLQLKIDTCIDDFSRNSSNAYRKYRNSDLAVKIANHLKTQYEKSAPSEKEEWSCELTHFYYRIRGSYDDSYYTSFGYNGNGLRNGEELGLALAIEEILQPDKKIRDQNREYAKDYDNIDHSRTTGFYVAYYHNHNRSKIDIKNYGWQAGFRKSFSGIFFCDYCVNIKYDTKKQLKNWND